MSYGLLKGKKGIIFGALDENSIAWKVAERCHEEGAEFVLTNAPIAMRMGEINSLAEKTGADIVPADATSMEDLEKLFDHAIAKFGKIDFILHSIGMSVNVRKGKHYTELNYDWLEKGWDVSAVSFHKVMKLAITIWRTTSLTLKASLDLSGITGAKEKCVSIPFPSRLQ